MFIIYAILIFAVLIFVHEAGHFIAARAVGIRVKEFAIGMGPKLLSKQRGETVYSLRAIPIGGFCAMEGEDEDSDDPRAFNSRSIPARALVLFSGALMNILMAVIILSIIIFFIGEPSSTIKEVAAESSAASLGLEAGDTIISMDGEKIEDWNGVSSAITAINEKNPEKGGAETVTLSIGVEKEDGTKVTLNPVLTRSEEDGLLRIGISPEYKKSPNYFFKSFKYGGMATWGMTKMMYSTIGQLLTGKVGVKELTGPVGIVKVVGDSAKEGVVYVFQIAALISLNLGIVNLLPFPALDGGRILFLIVRIFTGKRISEKTEGRIHFAGIVLLIGLMLYITVIDVNRFILN
jgi:regulator of sigma E protease